jgi:hypothetical protein
MPQAVKITRGFGRYVKGQIVTIGGGVADVWIRMGRAVPVPAAMPQIETASLEPAVERADRTPRRRKGR